MNEIKSHYNYPEVIGWIEKKGAELFGNHFRVVEDDMPVLFRLIAYFLKDESAAHQYNIDLEKGIILAGPVGCGKTTILTIMKSLATIDKKFYVKPCREVSFEFFEKGFPVIQNYSKGSQRSSGIICFDDLGLENNLKHFGNDCNVMAEVLLSRYDLFIAKKIPTHLTTNLSASEIEKHYGIRVRSRLREICNLIAFDSTTPDKRR